MKLGFIGLVVSYFLSGCSNPLADIINAKWPPVNADQQRQEAIDSIATVLPRLTTPSIAVGVALSDVKKVLEGQDLKKHGVAAVDIIGDKQLLNVKLDFARQFTEADAGDSAELKAFLGKLKPNVSGTIEVYAGLAVKAATGGPTPTVELRLLPGLSSLKVKKLQLAERVDSGPAVDLFAQLLTKYKDNVTGELFRQPFKRVVVPALAAEPLLIARSLHLSQPQGTATVELTGKPIVAPYKLDVVAVLVTNKEVTALVQLTPASSTATAPVVQAGPKTFDAIESRFKKLVEQSFAVPDASSGTWVALRKDVLAGVLNSVIGQADACMSVVAKSEPQHVSTTIPMPSGEGIECGSTRQCDSTRQCTFRANHDERSCSVCLIPSPRFCTRFGCIGGGGCITQRNDPICEVSKLAQNLAYVTDANLRQVDCDRLREQENAACGLQKAADKGLCEAKKGVLNALKRTGNFANVDVDARAGTDNLKICLRNFNMSPNLDSVHFALDVQGKGKASVNVKFTPLEIVGRLTCPFSWSKEEDFEATLRDSRLSISSDVQLVTDKDKTRLEFTVAELPVKAKLSPSPIEWLTNNPSMTVSCPIINAAKPLAVALSPFIKELRGEIDYRLQAQKVSYEVALPTQSIGDTKLASKVIFTGPALVVTGTFSSAKK